MRDNHYILLCWVLASASFTCSQASDASRTELNVNETRLAHKLIRALNADNYQLREKAQQSLLRLGRASIEPLEDATKAEESEVRLRAIELLMALRGRGLLGIQMMQPPLDAAPAWGAGVKLVMPEAPAALAGIQNGDTILSLNGQPVPDNNELQHLVFTMGPARVMDVVVERAGEKLHIPVMLTLNLTYPSTPDYVPPVDLEAELPESENPRARIAARSQVAQTGAGQRIIRANGGNIIIQGGGVVIINGVVIQNGGVIQGNTVTVGPNTPLSNIPASGASKTPVDPSAIEADFEKLKNEVEKSSLGSVSEPIK